MVALHVKCPLCETRSGLNSRVMSVVVPASRGSPTVVPLPFVMGPLESSHCKSAGVLIPSGS